MPKAPAGLTELTAQQLNKAVEEAGEPDYRARQLRSWVYHRLARSFDEMTDLPLHFRQKLAGEIRLHTLVPIESVTGKDGTVKVLFELGDGNTIESALMHYEGEGERGRNTVCASTQAGCAAGCSFCATGQQGFERNLTSGEIIDQVLYFAHYLREKSNGNKKIKSQKSERISNIVFMGMGEPLANYANLWQAIEMLNAPEGFGLGARNMVISTVGLVPQMKRLAKEKLQVGLAVSLHASNNKLRNTLVPINRKYPLEKLIPACREYSRLTGRRLSFEYVLIKGINDSIAQARELAELIKGIKCHVNLIPANETSNPSCKPPPYKAVLAFEDELKRNRINVTLRRSRGQDIAAGCGQLRSRFLKRSIRENHLRQEKSKHV
jgi:23S rRNA (adenine2503-C2)-methyltransferase